MGTRKYLSAFIKPSRGFSLVETLLGTAIGGILIVGALTFFKSAAFWTIVTFVFHDSPFFRHIGNGWHFAGLRNNARFFPYLYDGVDLSFPSTP